MTPPTRSYASLTRLARTLGGEAYDGGRRANIPAPGHSAADRSVSLLLVGDRVVAHGFGAVDWRGILDGLRRGGWIDAQHRLLASGRPQLPDCRPAPSRAERVGAAQRLWAEGGPITAGRPAALYARARAVDLGLDLAGALRAHSAAPAAIYRRRGPWRAALLAAVRDASGGLTAVEVTYLDARGRRAADARPPRKLVGVLPPGAAVRLAPSDDEMLVAEGVFTTLSAMRRFGLPGWALLSTSNLRRWTPPPGAGRILIAADRGPEGERSAARLRRQLIGLGIDSQVRLPPAGFGDWNDLDRAEAKGGRGTGARSLGDGP